MTLTLFVMITALSADPRAALVAARAHAYDANFRNDQAGLRAAIEEIQPLTRDKEVGAFAWYYSGWTKWALSSAQMYAGDRAGAIASAEGAASDIRAALKEKDLADFHAMLVNALITQVVLDRGRFAAAAAEISAARARALELGPTNPRVLIMDAGMIFNAPPERGGSQQKGIERWQEALRLFDAESGQPPADSLLPDWGRALAYGWVCDLYLRVSPPRVDEARRASARALELRPDFWYVKERILPRLRSAP